MPYSSTRELPPEVKKKYTSKQLRAFKAAFNSAIEDGKSESAAFKIAHSAAQKAKGDKASSDQKVKGSAMASDILLGCPDCDRSGFTASALAEHAAAVHTHSDIRQALQKVIAEQFPPGAYPRRYAYVRDVSDDWFVYEVEDSLPGGGYRETLFKQKYKFDNGVATVSGDPVEVRPQMTYVTVPNQGS